MYGLFTLCVLKCHSLSTYDTFQVHTKQTPLQSNFLPHPGVQIQDQQQRGAAARPLQMLNLLIPITSCLLISITYVLSLYVWPTHLGGRNHPTVIVRRFFSVGAVSAVAWIPAAVFHHYLQAQSSSSSGSTSSSARVAATTLQLLGLRSSGLLAAATLPLLAVALLFAGPLLHLVISAPARAQHALAAAAAAAAGGDGLDGSSSAAAVRLQLMRDLIVAPAAEEWVFRACMVSLLWLAVSH